MPDLWLAPYVPITAETEVDPWLFVPFHTFAQRHTRGRAVFSESRRLVTAYKQGNSLTRLGAVIVPREGRVGDEVPRVLLTPLRRARATALIDLNPSFLDSDDERSPNAGHAMASADNGLVYAHPLTGGESYVIAEGVLVRHLSLHHVPRGRRLPPIPPPPGLPKPMLGAGLDEEYASALFAVMTADKPTARRLDRCIQWQVVAWSNTEAIDEDTRVLALRAGFDVLLGGGSETRRHGRALGRLLGDKSKQRMRSWTEHGKSKHMLLNDTEWWFQSMALLRNGIAHGDAITDEQWLFEDGKRHLWHADDRLRRAIKRTVIAAGDADLELDPARRHLTRASREAVARLPESGADEALGGPDYGIREACSGNFRTQSTMGRRLATS
jgi:hypothetical protein